MTLNMVMNTPVVLGVTPWLVVWLGYTTTEACTYIKVLSNGSFLIVIHVRVLSLQLDWQSLTVTGLHNPESRNVANTLCE